jgi:predicted DNA-binding transcriptional regulator AlpA
LENIVQDTQMTAAQQLLTKKQVANRLQVSTRQIDRLVARSILPPPLRLGGRTRRWRQADIEAAIGGERSVNAR